MATPVEVVGCLGRIIARNATDELMPYIIQSIFLLVPPSLFGASIYMTLGRIMRGLGPDGEACSLIPVKWLTTLFVVGDVLGFVIQGGGAGLMAGGSKAELGKNIIIAGLFVQIAFFCLFVAVAILFDRRYRRRTVGGFKSLAASSASHQPGHLSEPPFDWKKLMLMLYATSGLILFRCIFRIVEYIMGPDAYLLATEWPLFAFDLTLMIITMVLFYVWHPVLIKPATDDSRSLRMELLSQNTTYGGGATGKTT